MWDGCVLRLPLMLDVVPLIKTGVEGSRVKISIMVSVVVNLVCAGNVID